MLWVVPVTGLCTISELTSLTRARQRSKMAERSNTKTTSNDQYLNVTKSLIYRDKHFSMMFLNRDFRPPCHGAGVYETNLRVVFCLNKVILSLLSDVTNFTERIFVLLIIQITNITY